jgi:hypothetical protein
MISEPNLADTAILEKANQLSRWGDRTSYAYTTQNIEIAS